jgi:hypothetical protein
VFGQPLVVRRRGRATGWSKPRSLPFKRGNDRIPHRPRPQPAIVTGDRGRPATSSNVDSMSFLCSIRTREHRRRHSFPRSGWLAVARDDRPRVRARRAPRAPTGVSAETSSVTRAETTLSIARPCLMRFPRTRHRAARLTLKRATPPKLPACPVAPAAVPAARPGKPTSTRRRRRFPTQAPTATGTHCTHHVLEPKTSHNVPAPRRRSDGLGSHDAATERLGRRHPGSRSS